MNLNKLNDCSKDSSSDPKIMEENCNTSNGNINNSSRSDAEDFVTASDCTGTPPSRSSSYHTPSEGEATSNSPWWELDTIIDADTTMDSSKCLQLTDESQQVYLNDNNNINKNNNTGISYYVTINYARG